MQKIPKEVPTTVSDEKKLKSINFWHWALMIFIVVWMGGAYVYLDKKATFGITHPPVVIVDDAGNINISNVFKGRDLNLQLYSTNGLILMPQNFKTKSEYQVGDVVVVKYFYVDAVVLKTVGEDCLIVYKNSEGALQKIILPKTLLMIHIN